MDFQKITPWLISLFCLCIVIAVFSEIQCNLIWFKKVVFDTKIDEVDHAQYRVLMLEIYISFIKRLLCFVTSIGLMFVGMISTFYKYRNSNTQANANLQSIKFELISNSPAIVALTIAGVLMYSSLKSQDKFPQYLPEKTINSISSPSPVKDDIDLH